MLLVDNNLVHCCTWHVHCRQRQSGTDSDILGLDTQDVRVGGVSLSYPNSYPLGSGADGGPAGMGPWVRHGGPVSTLSRSPEVEDAAGYLILPRTSKPDLQVLEE